jgi:hypothetical protein
VKVFLSDGRALRYWSSATPGPIVLVFHGCPTTLWAGELDEQAMTGAAWWLDRVPQAQVEVLPGATHLAALLTQWPAILSRLVGSRTATG